MNKLFIIGNGFDLAHGLPTSYQHLMSWYEKDVMSKLQKSTKFEDELFYISTNTGSINNIISPPDSLHILMGRDLADCKSELFQDLLYKYNDKNWVDIEYFYFEKLKEASQSKSRDAKAGYLNDGFQNIQNLLIKYLNTLSYRGGIIPNVLELFKPQEMVDRHLILNFNYTNTLNFYLEELKPNPHIEVVNIHGELNNNENPIIFGYGDQHDDGYTELENYNSNELLRFIKYPKYTLTDGFKRLSRFINSRREYEVYILGHSCGISDRTLLNEILENKYCDRVIIYYYPDKNDFLAKTTELTRHFKNKINYLTKVQPFDPSLQFPQLTKHIY